MKQDVVTEIRASTSQFPIGSRLRASRTRDTPRTETANGHSSGLKTRPRTSIPEPNHTAKSRKPLNKPKSGEDIPPKPREMEDPKLVINRPRIQAVEQYARLRRPANFDFRRAAEVSLSEETRKSLVGSSELQKRLEMSEDLVKNLEFEISALKIQAEELQNRNFELESQNRRFAEDLAAAEVKISALESHNQRAKIAEDCRVTEVEVCSQPSNNHREEVSNHTYGTKFRDIQKLIASKMEHMRTKESTKERITDKTQTVALEPETRIVDIQPKVAKKFVPPPPPPPPPRQPPTRVAAMQKAPALVELYHSLTKREGRKDPLGCGSVSNPVVMNAHSSIVGEIQNRSAHLLAIKADVERKGEFIKFLIHKVQTAAYTDIEDVLTFVDWLDKELSSLSDERAVLKHFDWPERKADAMREAAFEYRDLKRVEIEVSSYEDDPSVPSELALKKMGSLLDKSEQSIQRLSKLRDLTMPCYRDCKIPTDWMLDSGIVSKIKLGSVKLANKYMKRVSMELESVRHSDWESMQEGLLVQGVRFAYRAHQFAGGLDADTMCAFEEIRQFARAHGGGTRELLAGITS